MENYNISFEKINVLSFAALEKKRKLLALQLVFFFFFFACSFRVLGQFKVLVWDEKCNSFWNALLLVNQE